MVHNLKRFLTIEIGFAFSLVATTVWGVWSLQHGMRGLLTPSNEKEVVAKFGPHFQERSSIVNGVGSWATGSVFLDQSYASSYLTMARCIYFCDVVAGSSTLLNVIVFMALFSNYFCCGGQLSVSRLKGRLKLWLAFGVCTWCLYIGGLNIDTGNIILTTPPEAHSDAGRHIGLRYLLGIIPASPILLSFLWYGKLRRVCKGEEDLKGSSCLCSCIEWGWHIFWVVFLVFSLLFPLTGLILAPQSRVDNIALM